MPTFKLTDDEIQKLRVKFQQFKLERESVHRLLSDYIADYRQFNGTSEQRYEHLRRKFIDKVPDLSHLVFSNGEFLWSIDDISIVLGRHRTTISRSLEKMEHSEGWQSKIIAVREVTKASSGLKFYVYHQEIFDLILDLYEEEYLFRFANPRRGNPEDAPDFQEVKKFWDYLKDFERSKNFAIQREQKILPEIPAMNYKDIFKLIWEKVFSIKIGTVCSVIFAVCFELTRRFLGVNVLWGIIPGIIFLVSALLIRCRKFSPDFLSNLGAGALLFTFLWISASLSLDKINEFYENDDLPEKISKQVTEQISEEILEKFPEKLSEKILEKIPEKIPEKIIPKLAITPFMKSDFWNYAYVNFNINSNVYKNIKEIFYRISPDVNFKSLGFLKQTNPENNNPYPAYTIYQNRTSGIIDIDVKYIDNNNNESEIWNFSRNLDLEKIKLGKEITLKNKNSWLYLRKYPDNTIKLRLEHDLLSRAAISCIREIMYGINKDIPDVRLFYKNYTLPGRGNFVFDEWEVISINPEKNYMKYISSYLIFKDGTSSDVRINKL